jgi:probable HAF family extracellular repeat protein
MTDVGALLVGSTDSEGVGINTAGNVVGVYHNASGDQRPFVYTNGVARDLGFSGCANCINDAGQIGGFENTNGHLGFIISGGLKQYVGTLGGTDTEVGKINTNGLAVGNSLTSGGTFHAYSFKNGIMRDLGTLGGDSSGAYGLNNLGQIVGEAKDAQGVFRAYVYRGGVMLDLNNFLPVGSGWFLTIAYGINKAGQPSGLPTGARLRRSRPAAFPLRQGSRTHKQPGNGDAGE